MLAAILRASSLLSNLAADSPARLILEIDVSGLLAGVISLIAGGALKGLTTQNRPYRKATRAATSELSGNRAPKAAFRAVAFTLI